jgi:hypothetical protein
MWRTLLVGAWVGRGADAADAPHATSPARVARTAPLAGTLAGSAEVEASGAACAASHAASTIHKHRVGFKGALLAMAMPAVCAEGARARVAR